MDVPTTPHSTETEQCVIGAALKDPEAMDSAAQTLPTGDHFYTPNHKVIWDAMLRVYHSGNVVDIVTLSGSLSTHHLKAIGGRVALVDIMERARELVASTANTARYAQEILDLSIRRQSIGASEEFIRNLYGNDHETAHLLSMFEDRLFQLQQGHSATAQWHSIAEILPEVMEDIQGFQSGQISDSWCLTGIDNLDKIILGLRPGDVYFVAGRPGEGKTQLVIQIADWVAAAKKPVGIISMEMLERELVTRLLAVNANYSSSQLQTKGTLMDSDWDALIRHQGELHQRPIYIIDDDVTSPEDLRPIMRRAISKYNCKLFIIDYLQCLRGQGENETARITDVSRRIKECARHLRVPILVCSALARPVRGRERKEAEMSDLRSSGQLEFDASIVLMLHHEEKDGEKKSYIRVKKNRYGPSGDRILMRFEQGRWDEVTFQREDREVRI